MPCGKVCGVLCAVLDSSHTLSCGCISDAVVGDDVMMDDPTVLELEATAAKVLAYLLAWTRNAKSAAVKALTKLVAACAIRCLAKRRHCSCQVAQCPT